MTTHAEPHGTRAELKLALAALGVVYGDIGTSPLYAVNECFSKTHGVAATHGNVLGIMSLFFWSMTLVIVVKYLTFVLRADNKGEGGILALLALLRPDTAKPVNLSGRTGVLVLFGLFGAALLYGDGMITPAISVLSAVEGLSLATRVFDPVVVPLTAGILVALFLMQRRGTEGIGQIFGPTTLLWFITLACMGAPWIFKRPDILFAIDPRHAVSYFAANGLHGFLVLGSVVLCITGGEALYADMGHFGRGPIRKAWYAVVFPALLINYFGQGALLLERGAGVSHPFHDLVDGWVRYPVIAIATAATVVASQALITGAYSITRQAIQLGYCPRLTVVHTSGETEGQIYMPHVNNALMVACVALVVAACIFTLMTTWKRGRAALGASLAEAAMPLDGFLKDWAVQHTTRVSGTGVFMASNLAMVSPVLLHHFKHTHVLHEQVVLLSVVTEDVPEVLETDRLTWNELGQGFYQVIARYGFMESPNVPRVIERCRLAGLPFSRNDLSYYLGRETLITTGKSKMAGWRKGLFWTMSRNALPATAFFQLPPDQVVEVGTQVEI